MAVLVIVVVVGIVAAVLAAAYAWDRRHRNHEGTAIDAAHKVWAIDREGQWWNCGSPASGASSHSPWNVRRTGRAHR